MESTLEWTKGEVIVNSGIGSYTPSPCFSLAAVSKCLSLLEPCAPPPQASGLGPKWGDANSCGEGEGGPNSDEGTETLLLLVYFSIIPLRCTCTVLSRLLNLLVRMKLFVLL
jgi:hypothetical protein